MERYYSDITLRASLEPEVMAVYAESNKSPRNPTGYLGLTAEIQEEGVRTKFKLHNSEDVHYAGSVFYDFVSSEFNPLTE